MLYLIAMRGDSIKSDSSIVEFASENGSMIEIMSESSSSLHEGQRLSARR